MDLSTEPVESKVHRIPAPPVPGPDASTPVLERIRNRGVLRVGYLKDQLPFVFNNTAGRLVGYDVEMAHILAGELGATVEFVVVERDLMTRHLDVGTCDIIMSGTAVTTNRSREVKFSEFYLDQTFAFLVEDHRRDEFDSREKVLAINQLKVGVLDVPYYVAKVREYLPHAEIVTLDSLRPFFRREVELDALAHSAEAGSAWTLVYPDFSVAIPLPDLIAIPLAYSMPKHDGEWKDFIDTWVRLKKKDGTTKRLYERWILGQDAAPRGPRWSVIRDVLHWVE
jgi:ABC-type amino acid transport substrate-binding protein